MATAQTICYRSDSYRNWVRGSVGLGYLQEGLQVFAETIVQTEHRNILQRIGKCGKCSIESIMPAHAKQGHCIQKNRRRCNCTKKGNIYCAVCSKTYDEIIIQHRFIDPNWEIDSAGLFSDHWQFAKCFMTTTKKESNNTAAETDAACLLSIIINGNFFQAELDTIIDGENDIFSQAKKVRNAILHSSKLELTEDEVTEYLKTMIDVLQDRKVLMNDKAAQTAVTKITYIMNTKFVITTGIEKSAIESAQRSIKGTGELCENGLKELTSQSLAEISRAKEDAIDEIEKNKPKDRNASGAGIAIGQDTKTKEQ
ncbi:uncharacterized protein LOC123539421 [Mercenaria mercenaria]|uniref:uncharacterized protein LOC123539421 n=1 Tax=Mercenaria mercenaria TaxID=6596 RepID=UPI00234F781E|nr:uncharacterized protein LOC123539421 [Mercenaria mercenaria]